MAKSYILEAEPRNHCETGAMDGACTRIPDVFGVVTTDLLRRKSPTSMQMPAHRSAANLSARGHASP